MNIRHIAAIIPLICLVGCASTDTEQDFDRALEARWSHIPESDFPPPATTPYDSDVIRRNQYLKGYSNGVREQLQQFRAGKRECGDRLRPTEEDRPYFDGNRDGALAVMVRSDTEVEAMTTELKTK